MPPVKLAMKKMTPEEFARRALLSAPEQARAAGRKVFFVNYKFLSCGEVFRDGLSHAAEDLGVEHEAAYWDDPALPDSAATILCARSCSNCPPRTPTRNV